MGWRPPVRRRRGLGPLRQAGSGTGIGGPEPAGAGFGRAVDGDVGWGEVVFRLRTQRPQQRLRSLFGGDGFLVVPIQVHEKHPREPPLPARLVPRLRRERGPADATEPRDCRDHDRGQVTCGRGGFAAPGRGECGNGRGRRTPRAAAEAEPGALRPSGGPLSRRLHVRRRPSRLPGQHVQRPLHRQVGRPTPGRRPRTVGCRRTRPACCGCSPWHQAWRPARRPWPP